MMMRTPKAINGRPSNLLYTMLPVQGSRASMLHGHGNTFFFFKKNIYLLYLFIWLCLVLVAADGLLSCGRQAP